MVNRLTEEQIKCIIGSTTSTRVSITENPDKKYIMNISPNTKITMKNDCRYVVDGKEMDFKKNDTLEYKNGKYFLNGIEIIDKNV